MYNSKQSSCVNVVPGGSVVTGECIWEPYESQAIRAVLLPPGTAAWMLLMVHGK